MSITSGSIQLRLHFNIIASSGLCSGRLVSCLTSLAFFNSWKRFYNLFIPVSFMILKLEICDIATKVGCLFVVKSNPFFKLHLHKIFFVDNLSFLQTGSLGGWSLALGHHPLYLIPLRVSYLTYHKPCIAIQLACKAFIQSKPNFKNSWYSVNPSIGVQTSLCKGIW